MKQEEYLPVWVEFDVTEDEDIPMVLGEFESLEDVHNYMRENAVTVNQSIRVDRHMDNTEKAKVRENYREVLEDTLPKLEREHASLQSQLNEAKKKEKDASDRVNASFIEAKLLAKEAKHGMKEIRLDDQATFRVPYEGKYYFYTYINKHLKLCAIREIPEHEKNEVWNSGIDNSKLFGHESAETQEGAEEQLSEVTQ